MDRIREDLPEAQPIIAEIDALVSEAARRHAEMEHPDIKMLTHPGDLLTAEERTRLHELKMRLRPKSAQEARADILSRRAARKA